MCTSLGSNGVITLVVLACSFLCINSMPSTAFFPTFKQLGYYTFRCPNAEYIVRQEVNKAVSRNPGIAAGLIRLHFHDCFVRGCDASVLLDSIRGKAPSEKESPANKGSLRGLEVIDAAKAKLEAACPGIVSCADILAFAARDSAYKVGKIFYKVRGGRRDGRVSLASEVLENLPSPSANVSKLIASFAKKGMSIDEMVTLSGAHSIGISHCSSFANRLFPTPDPSMDPAFAAFLTKICNSTRNPTVVQDFVTPNRLDKKYYMNLQNRRGLFTSDQSLLSSTLTSKMVKNNARYGSIWAKKFAAAMVHMSSIDVLRFPMGEIRKNCHFVN